MNLRHSPNRRPSTGRDAFALILVLITLTLAVIVVIFYLSTIGRERSAVDMYTQQSRVRQLADLPISIVQAQINAATKEGILRKPISWASQPGMLRTYDTGGNLAHAYKLYSWDNLTEDANFDPFANAQLPASAWESNPSLYTDLNQPVNGIYPIADPISANFGSESSFSGSNVPWDFTSAFAVDKNAGAYYEALGQSAVANSTAVKNTLPMPVKWIYVLKDGTWAAPDSAPDTAISFPNTVKVSLLNPIVGRIAFWSDDETSKVNINTASEGAYWDWPKSATRDEMQLAANPPSSGEFQRISGHPSTTSLSAVLPELRPSATAYSRWNTLLSGANANYVNSMGTIYDMLPRIGGGLAATTYFGSVAGTYPAPYNQQYPTDVTTFATTKGTAFYTADKYAPVVINPLRLYTTADDFWYKPGKVAGNPSGFLRDGNTGFLNSTMYNGDPAKLRQRLFFLTASSRAPETTLFETPRISLWPITWPYPAAYYFNQGSGGSARGPVPTASTVADATTATGDTILQLNKLNPNGATNITAQEQLIAFDSTLNKTAASPAPYYFQRQSSDSPTRDWQITRNRQLANYLRGEIGADVPGFGANLTTKWDLASVGTSDWITLNIMDYSRSMINQYMVNPNPANTALAGSIQYSYAGVGARKIGYQDTATTASIGGDHWETNSFTVTPLRIAPSPTDTPNFSSSSTFVTEGAYPSLKEVSVMFYATKRNEPKFIGKSAKTVGTPGSTNYKNPFLWENLICVPRENAALGIPKAPGSNQAGLIPNSVYTNQSSNDPAVRALDRDEVNNLYPANIQTTEMKAVMFFRFTGLRTTGTYRPSGIQYNPTFWINVNGDSFVVGDANGGSPINIGLPKDRSRSVKYMRHPTIGDGPGENPAFMSMWREDFVASYTDNATPPATRSEWMPKRFDNRYQKSWCWSLVSDAIAVNGNPTSPQFEFTLTGKSQIVSIYAPYPYDPSTVGRDPSIDPTGDPNQLVAQYTVDFNKWSQKLPIPTAPFWNARTPSAPNASIGFPRGVPYFIGFKDPDSSIQVPDCPWVKSDIAPSYSAGNDPAMRVATNLTDRTVAIASIDYSDGTRTLDKVPMDASSSSTNSSVSRNWVPYAYNVKNSTGELSDPNSVRPYNKPSISGTPDKDYPAITPFSTQMENRVASLSYRFVDAYSGSALFDTNGWTGSSIITPYDTVISMITDPTLLNQGDPRLTLLGSGGLTEQNFFVRSDAVFAGLMTNRNVTSVYSTQMETDPLKPAWVVSPSAHPRFAAGAQYHQLSSPSTTTAVTGFQLQPKFYNPTTSQYTLLGVEGVAMAYTVNPTWNVGISLETTALMVLNSSWDWTSQPGNSPDGGYIARADQEYGTLSQDIGTMVTDLLVPYFSRAGVTFYSTASNTGGATTASTPNFFSPNRQVPSPIVLGTIPSSLMTGWQTLCFSPNPGKGSTHPGVGKLVTTPAASGKPYSSALPDHVLLDFLWMPVAEPYPVSEQFSTAGKINLNYAIMPFPYIKRKTGMDAVLKGVWIYALENTDVFHSGASPSSNPMSWDYKSTLGLQGDATRSRFPVHVENTLKAFDYKFKSGDIFRSASQICDVFLYPTDPADPTGTKPHRYNGTDIVDTAPSTTNVQAWWAKQTLTSDNGREEPYNSIYSRVTTKSNTFTVHWKVQSLRKVPSTDATTWVEGRDQVASELRGSTLIERYLDPNANNIPDYASLKPSSYPNDNTTGAQPMSYYYKWRVAAANYFQP